jgi:nucleoid-associated protein YgaU
MGNSAKFMLVGILVVVLLIAMIWDRSNENPAEGAAQEQYANAMRPESGVQEAPAGDPVEDVIAEGTFGDDPPTTLSDFNTRSDTADTSTGTPESADTGNNDTGFRMFGEDEGSTGRPDGDTSEDAAVPPVNPIANFDEPEDPPAARTYTTVEGDSYWSVSEKVYGTGAKWKKLHEANKDVCPVPEFMKTGMKLVVPALEEPAPRPAAREEIIPPARDTETADAGGPKVYVVKSGDSLWKIAEKELGNGLKHELIFKLNKDRLESEHDLKVGMKLRMP